MSLARGRSAALSCSARGLVVNAPLMPPVAQTFSFVLPVFEPLGAVAEYAWELGFPGPSVALGVLVRDHVEVCVGAARTDAGELEVGPTIGCRPQYRLARGRSEYLRTWPCDGRRARCRRATGGCARACAARVAGDEAIHPFDSMARIQAREQSYSAQRVCVSGSM